MSEQMREKRRIMEDEMEGMRKETLEQRRQMEVEKAELVERAKQAEGRCDELSHRVSALEHRSGHASEMESAVGEAELKCAHQKEEFEHERSIMKQQIADLQQSLMDTSQTFAMLQIRNKENMILSAVRRAGYRLLRRILQSWSVVPSKDKHALEGVGSEAEAGFDANSGGDMADGSSGAESQGVAGAKVDGEQLRMMEDWVKDLTETVDALKKENALLLSQQQPGVSNGGLYRAAVASEEVKGCRAIFDSWHYFAATSRSERRGPLLQHLSQWRNCCQGLRSRESAARELELLEEELSHLQGQLKAAHATVLNEQETSEKLVFLLTEKEATLEKLRRDLSQAQEELRARAPVENEGQDRREHLAAAEAKVALLEEHIEEMGRKDASARRQLEEKDREADRLKCRVEELQAQLQQARVREKIWVLETTGNLSDSGSGRRNSAGSEGQLRGVRLLCLEKAYIFTQHLIRQRSKRHLLRIMYCWGSFAAATRLEEEAALAVQPKVPLVECSTWTGPFEDMKIVAPVQQESLKPEQDGTARERVELATSLAISQERVHALEAKVEELMAVEEAYRKAHRLGGLHSEEVSDVPKETHSPQVGADSTMATLSLDCTRDADFDDTGADADTSPLQIQSSNASNVKQGDGVSMDGTFPDVQGASTRPAASKTPEACHLAPRSIHNGPEIPESLAVNSPEIPEMSPLLYATSDWHMSSPILIEAQAVSVPAPTPGGQVSASETIPDDDFRADIHAEGREESGALRPCAQDAGGPAKSSIEGRSNAGQEGEAQVVAVVGSMVDFSLQGSELTPSAMHRGHVASSDPLAVFDHALAYRQDDLARVRAGIEDNPAREGHPHQTMQTPRKDGGGVQQEQCLTPRSMLLNELRAFSNTLSGAIFSGPSVSAPQLQAPSDPNATTRKDLQGPSEQEGQDVLTRHGNASLQRIRVPKEPSTPDSKKSDGAAAAEEQVLPTALSRITAMPNPFTGSPGCFGQRRKSSNASRAAAVKGNTLVEELACAQTRQITNRAAKLSDLMQESLSIFASPHKAHPTDSRHACGSKALCDGLVRPLGDARLLHGEPLVSADSHLPISSMPEAEQQPGWCHCERF